MNKNIPITAKNKCQFCPGSRCCNYVTQHIDTPRAMDDFDTLLWQVSHQNVTVYRDEDGWFLLFQTTCSHLQDNGQCGIYPQRPQICRNYDNDYCEYDSPAEEGFELYFTNYDELFAYCEKRFKSWHKHLQKNNSTTP